MGLSSKQELYLAQHSITEWLDTFVQDLVAECPESPADFMVQWAEKQKVCPIIQTHPFQDVPVTGPGAKY